MGFFGLISGYSPFPTDRRRRFMTAPRGSRPKLHGLQTNGHIPARSRLARRPRKLELPLSLFLCYHNAMIKSGSDNTTPRWKRSAVKGTLVGVRLQPHQMTALDAWIARQDAPLTRPEAIRAMMETILHILSKDQGEKSAKKVKAK